MLQRLEDLITDVVSRVLSGPHGALVRELNPSFVAPQKPFKRMDYADGIKWLNEHGIKKEDGTDFVFGEDINEAPERKMTDTIGQPILFCRFPAEIKVRTYKGMRDIRDERNESSINMIFPYSGFACVRIFAQLP